MSEAKHLRIVSEQSGDSRVFADLLEEARKGHTSLNPGYTLSKAKTKELTDLGFFVSGETHSHTTHIHW